MTGAADSPLHCVHKIAIRVRSFPTRRGGARTEKSRATQKKFPGNGKAEKGAMLALKRKNLKVL